MAKEFISRARVAVLSLILLSLTINDNNLLPVAEGIWLQIPGSGTKCISEEIQNNVVVLAEYYVVDEEQPENNITVSAQVTSPYGNNLHKAENVTHGRFAFTTHESGSYLACFSVENNVQESIITLGIDWKTGIAAKDWDSVAKKEKIEGVELHLRRLEGSVEQIHKNLIHLIIRDAKMREVSEATNARVAWFGIMSLGVCIVVSVLQLWRLKRYFKKKKLI